MYLIEVRSFAAMLVLIQILAQGFKLLHGMGCPSPVLLIPPPTITWSFTAGGEREYTTTDDAHPQKNIKSTYFLYAVFTL